jgi:hypothetical protein
MTTCQHEITVPIMNDSCTGHADRYHAAEVLKNCPQLFSFVFKIKICATDDMLVLKFKCLRTTAHYTTLLSSMHCSALSGKVSGSHTETQNLNS